MNEEELEKLIKLSSQDFKCDNVNCCEYGEYNQCFNHSHILCPIYEVFIQSKSDRRKK